MASDTPQVAIDTRELLKYAYAHPELVERERRRWGRIARAKQLEPPLPWRIWFLLTGRGFGKTLTLSQWAHDRAAEGPSAGFIAGRVMPDVHRVLLHHPKSGLLVTQRPENPCTYSVARNAVEWESGARATFFSSDVPDSARGPEHSWGIADEVGTWTAVKDFTGNTLFSNLLFGLRGGAHPRMAVATTPRPTSYIVKDLLEMAQEPLNGVVVVRGSMLENRANLPEAYIQSILKRYQGTHLGRQEIDGDLAAGVEGALVAHGMWEELQEPGPQDRIVVGVDPSGSGRGDEAGIVAMGRQGELGTVLGDRSCQASPEVWGARAVELYHRLEADLIVAETNYGGDTVISVIHHVDRNVPVKKVTASRGKHVRFEPLALRYQRGEMRHVRGLQALEDQVTSFTAEGYEGGGSPDRADALVWAHAELFPTQDLSWSDFYPELRQ